MKIAFRHRVIDIFLPLGLACAALLFVAGCQSMPEETASPAPPAATDKVPGEVMIPVAWDNADTVLAAESSLTDWADAIEASVGYFARKKPEAKFKFGAHEVAALAMSRAMQKLAAMARTRNRAEFTDYLKDNFLLFRSVGNDGRGNVLVTAYYEPLLHGSKSRSNRYRHPLYTRPGDLLQVNLDPWLPQLKKRIVARLDGASLQPYYDREEIELEKRLADKNLELVWVDDPLDLFFLQIQGSGRVQLDDGGVMLVGYNGANGRPYRSIGKILIDEGAISRKDMSLPALRKWLKENPAQQDRILNANPSYVFFRKLSGGPYGNISVALTPERSIATDHRIFPKGAPGMLITTIPHFTGNGSKVEWRQSARFIVNQDTGGAIRGPGRVDLFLGFGDAAEKSAGIMKQSGSSLFFIAPK